MRSALAVLLLCAAAFAADFGKVTTHKVADGVYLFTTTNYADVGMCGNSVAIVGRRSVLVFDTTATPRTAATVLAEIRKLTPLPVAYVVNSHWHWDHWGGNQAFADAFPGARFITHAKTAELMRTVEPRWNDRGLKQDLPRFLDDFSRQVADLKAQGAAPDRIARAEERLAADRAFYEQKSTLRKLIPDSPFDDSIVLDLGGRLVEIRHARAITPGDTYLWLPRQKILVAGDILDDPFPFAIGGSYPRSWTETLRTFVAMQPAMVIPGHGAAQPGTVLAQRNLAMMEAVRADLAAGLPANDAAAPGPGEKARPLSLDAKKYAAMVGAEDAKAFQSYFLDVFARRARRELEAPLDDLPDGLE